MKTKILIATLFSFLLITLNSFAEDSIWDKSKTNIAFDEKPKVMVYYNTDCGCCKDWLTHLEKNGLEVKAVAMDDVQPIKDDYKLPPQMASCHTAIVDGYVIEGHVPADDIKKLITEKPKDIVGLSVPQMPVGTPGMEMGNRKDSFQVIAFDKKGNLSVYNEYKQY